MKVIQITIKDEMNEIEFDKLILKTCASQFTDHSITRGKGKIKPLYSWNYENETIVCYGWTQGDAGQENKHELVPLGDKLIHTIDTSDTQLLFGDIFLLKKKKRIQSLTIDDCALLYQFITGGEDACSENDETEDDDDDEGNDLDDFIVAEDGDESSDDEYYPSDYELDIDDHTY